MMMMMMMMMIMMVTLLVQDEEVSHLGTSNGEIPMMRCSLWEAWEWRSCDLALNFHGLRVTASPERKYFRDEFHT